MNLTKDDMEKALGRFQLLDYSMEPITTYHIVGAAIKKKDEEIWQLLRDKKIAVLDKLIRRIVGTEGGVRKYNRLKDLFPIHPYTAYLSTFIVRNIGSTERSIFNFLYDEEKGFRKFINENPVNNNGTLLTADYLWDFFKSEFERVDYQRFSAILDKYNLYIKSIEKENHAYGVIFRGVLLLNVLYKMVNVAEAKEILLIAPSIDNIKAMFSGTEYESDTDTALEFFDAEEKISKDPDDLFLVMSSILPTKEVVKIQEELKSKYNQIDTILSKKHTEEIKIAFISAILRETEMNIFDASLNQHLMRSKLNKAFKFDYSLHIALLIAQNIHEREQIKETIQNISQDGEIDNVVFIVLDDLFDETVLDKFIEYNARAVVAERHNFKEEQVSNHEYANKILEQWVNGIKSGYADWYLGRDKGKALINDFSTIVNDNLSTTIFYSGLETLGETKKNKVVWDGKFSKASVERFLFADNRDVMETMTSSAPYKYTREIVKNNNRDYIVDNQLQFKKEVDTNHPLVRMSREIEKVIKKKSNSGVFNLGESLKFLTRPPFGLYPNILCMAASGFLMRSYVGKLYDSGKGKPIEREIMRDKILSMFKYWNNGADSNKLEVRLGTKEEETLIKGLAFIFSLEKIQSLNQVKWGIRSWIKESEYPLWVFKLSEDSNDEINLAIDKITSLIESLDQEITRSDVKSLLNIINVVEIDLKRFILKKEKARKLFVSWLKRIDYIEIKREEIDSVVGYIRQHMPEERGVHSWKEDNVREKAKDWFLKKSKPLVPPPPPPDPPDDKNYPPDGGKRGGVGGGVWELTKRCC